MSTASPTFSQLKAQVVAIRQKVPRTRVIGIRASGRWTAERQKRDGEQSYLIQQCDSPLAMRLALREPADDATTKILITPLEEKDLSDDILLRLAKRRLFPIDPWQIVRSLFQAQTVDPRLSHCGWIAETLLDLIPAEGYPAVRGGFLDADTVWPLLLRYGIRLAVETPDLTSLLKWSLDADATARFRNASTAFREAAGQWLSEKAGPAAEVVLSCVSRLDRPDAVPLGLAVGVVYHTAAAGKLERACGKLEERFFGGNKPPDATLVQRWSTAATEVVRALRHTDARAYRQTLQRADEIVSEVQAEGFAYLSGTSPIGFDQRLARFGQCLDGVLANKAWDVLDGLVEGRQAVRDHDQSAREARRLERVDMAVRLVRWLGERRQQAGDEPKSLVEAAAGHRCSGGFVDWARLSLRSGDPVQVLSEAYAKLFEAVTQVREAQAHGFARLLVDWTAAGSQGGDLVPVERVLDEIVAPLAADRPVLVIVIDGMSVAVCRELLADLTRHEWVPLCEVGRTFNRPGIATVPSVTEFSRTSLLTGRLQAGGAAEERTGFVEHPALAARCRSGSPPILFHKPTLQEAEDAILAADVRKEIGSAHRKVVGVVVNAVDDNLLKGQQIDVQWSRDEIEVLPALLHEARMARRLVVLVSDHGHVLDCQTQARPCEGGERWRAATGEPAADELLIEGNRVAVEGHRLIAPWSERVRYGVMKNGYHGGLTPQEMVVPIVVLSSTDKFPAGWREQPVDTPAWWDEPARIEPVAEQPVPVLKPAEPEPGTLFDLRGGGETSEEPKKIDEPKKADEACPAWVPRLLASAVFEQQKQLGGRGLPGVEVFTKLLATLDRRGGKMTSVALARALEFPVLRLPGLLAKAQRVLNIDGYAVLSRDDASDTVELNRELLLKQFDLILASEREHVMIESKKPPVWKMIREAIDALGEKTTNIEVRDWILEHYPGTNTNTIQCHIIVCTVNHPSRIHYPVNSKPRLAAGQYDFLFRTEKGKLELFDVAAHGAWKIAEDEGGRLTVCACDEPPNDDSAGNAFAAEAHLRDYLAQHLDEVEEGLELFVDDAEVSGVEYPTPIGRIDILAVDKQGGLVVIELKVKQGPDAVAGQVLRYTNWVRCHLAHNKPVRGIIIAQHISDKIRYAIANDPAISAREYQLHLTFSNVAKLDFSATGGPSYEP